MRYLGDGEFIIADGGVIVPARDLTREEGIEHRDAIHANEKATGRPLYEPIHEPKDEPKDPAKDGK